MKKVFCKNCKWHNHPNVDGNSIYDYCFFFQNKFFDAVRSYFLEPKCDEINSKNNCEFYEKGWWKFWVK